MCIRDSLTAGREDASGGDAAQTLGRGGRVTRGKQPAGLTQLGLESTPVYGSTTRARPRALLGPLGHGNIIDGIARTYPPLRATGRITMAKLIYSGITSLDGYVAGED